MLRLVFGKEFGAPDIKIARLPIQPKKSLTPTIVDVPYRDPATLLLQEQDDFRTIAAATKTELPTVLASACKVEDAELGSDLSEHPAYIQAIRDGVPRSKIFIVAFYIDGVQYTNQESFLNFQMTNLTTSKQWCLWAIRPMAALEVPTLLFTC
jgi:hypothetical protein